LGSYRGHSTIGVKGTRCGSISWGAENRHIFCRKFDKKVTHLDNVESEMNETASLVEIDNLKKMEKDHL
jgi:hypothetical protein